MKQNVPQSLQFNDDSNADSIKDSFVQNDITVASQSLTDLGVDLDVQELDGVDLYIASGYVRIKTDGGIPTGTEGIVLSGGSYSFSKAEARKLLLIRHSTETADVEVQIQPITFLG